MQTLFYLLADKYPSAAQCAAALGLTRQAYSQAQKRRQLSNSAALKAAALLDIDAGKALLINATAKDLPAPISDPCPNPATDQTPAEPAPPPLYYVK